MEKFQYNRLSAILALSLLAASSVLALSLAAPSAAASGTKISITTSNGSTVCPNLGGTWTSSTDTCSISSDSVPALVVPYGVTLDVGTGVTLAVTGQRSYGIQNYGTIHNAGSITVSSSFDAIDNYGTIYNGGTMTGSAGLEKGIYNTGLIKNDGTMTGKGGTYNLPGIDNDNYGTIYNDGTMTGISTHSIGIVNSGTIYNDGTINGSINGIDNYGTIYNDGTIIY